MKKLTVQGWVFLKLSSSLCIESDTRVIVHVMQRLRCVILSRENGLFHDPTESSVHKELGFSLSYVGYPPKKFKKLLLRSL